MEDKREDILGALEGVLSKRAKSEERATSTPPRTPSLSHIPIAPHQVPSVSSASGERSTPIRPEATPPRPATTATAPTTAAAASDSKIPGWDPQLYLYWVQFPGSHGPVMGWLRTQAPTPWTPMFFGCDGEVRTITKESLMQYIYSSPDGTVPQNHPRAVSAHPRLQTTIRHALREYRMVHDRQSGEKFPIYHEAEWKARITYDSPDAFPYTVYCVECSGRRYVHRMESTIVERLPLDHPFRCTDLGTQCRLRNNTALKFAVNPLPPNPPSLIRSSMTNASFITAPPQPSYHPLTLSALTQSTPAPPPASSPAQSGGEDRSGRGWRKRIKDWSNIPKYEGTGSLVLLKGWQKALREAFRETEVPEGRDQVLAAAHFFGGAASKWWAHTLGQTLGDTLVTFELLCEALARRFIPQDTQLKAVDLWSALKQRGTVDEYMEKVDDLAAEHPLGEAGEFWHAWRGLRPELRAEVRYALLAKSKETCSREELREILKGLEVKYPAPVAAPRPFFPRPAVRQVQTAPVQQTQIVCWICDKSGHRAGECSRRKSSGCPRCGSKAHTLLTCPQRRPPRPPGRQEQQGGTNRSKKGTAK